MSEPTFTGLGLPETLLSTLTSLGYQKPSPIQAQAIPLLLAGRDLIGQAQTGTGKTAAFALPILATMDNTSAKPQALILTPTRELAMQVAEAFTRYSENLGRCKVLAVYGGQSMRDQLQELKRGVQIVVGTPGRLLDHLNRKSLDLSSLRTVVMDEADEMLRMGFIDDVEAILAHTGGTQQTALFSATMPPRIKNIADRYLREPERIVIPAATATVSSIAQHVVWARQREKPLAVARLLAAEDFDAAIIFARTREATTEIAEYLSNAGYAATAINGDMNQSQREQTIALLKSGKIDILVATDVAARGLDVERISLVINYDLAHEPDTYVHRIGRTGRAGRSGRAVLLADPRDRRGVRGLEQFTRQPLLELQLPSDAEIKQRRNNRFRQTLAEKLGHADSASWGGAVEELRNELGLTLDELAAGMLALLADQQGVNAKLPAAPAPVPTERFDRGDRHERGDRGSRHDRNVSSDRPRRERSERSDAPMDRYRIAVGRVQEVRVSDIVGAIANEAGINSANIGRIQLFDDYSTVDLPQGMPKDIFETLKSVRLRGHMMNIAPFAGGGSSGDAPAPRKKHYGSSTSRAPREGREGREAREPSRKFAGESAPRKRLALKAK
ncbi:MAG: DEAD/DEAH box helicase [Spongiibacteraceae bacterium]